MVRVLVLRACREASLGALLRVARRHKRQFKFRDFPPRGLFPVKRRFRVFYTCLTLHNKQRLSPFVPGFRFFEVASRRRRFRGLS